MCVTSNVLTKACYCQLAGITAGIPLKLNSTQLRWHASGKDMGQLLMPVADGNFVAAEKTQTRQGATKEGEGMGHKRFIKGPLLPLHICSPPPYTHTDTHKHTKG